MSQTAGNNRGTLGRAANRFPVTAQDMFNYIARYTASNHQLNCVLAIDGLIDTVILSKAVRHTVDIESILRCRFVECPEPYWEEREDIDSLNYISIVETNKPDLEMEDFVVESLDPCVDPLLKVRVIRAKTDYICIKVDHACCDGGGLKEYVSLLADAYTGLMANTITDIKKTGGRRDQGQVFEVLNITDPRQAWDSSRGDRQATWGFPSNPGIEERPKVAVRRISGEEFSRLVQGAQHKGCTINDILMTAFYRGYYEVVKPGEGRPMDIELTVDLRRYIPDGHTGVLCNLSGSETVTLDVKKGERFKETLAKAIQQARRMKQGLFGMQTAFVFEVFQSIGFNQALDWFRQMRQQAVQNKLANPFLSNFGEVSSSTIKFGCRKVIDAYMVSPVFFAPGLMLGVSTYREVLTLTIGFYQTSTDSDNISLLLDQVITQLQAAGK